MHCLGCAIAHGETIAEAAMVQGIDVDELLNELNA
jgi:hybrid cluster-associated redox disulfide protein